MQLLDMAGTALRINHFLNKNNIYSKCFVVTKPNVKSVCDYYGIMPYPRFKRTLLSAIKSAKNFDIIHIHSVETIVPIFKLLGKKVVLHYHGSDINETGRSKNPKRVLCRMMADYVIYNAEIMESKLVGVKKNKRMYLPNFVDTELFKPDGTGNGSVIMVSSNLDIKKSTAHIESDTTVYNFDNEKRIEYSNMPKFLNQFKKYYDDKVTDYGMLCTEFSNVGLQALACDLDVIHLRERFKTLPKNRTPEFYLEQLKEIYKKVMKD